MGRELAADLVQTGIDDAFGRAHLPVGLLALAGLALLVIGAVSKSGSIPRPPAPPAASPPGPMPGPGVWQPAQQPPE